MFNVETGQVVAVAPMLNQQTSEVLVVQQLLEQLQLAGVCISLDALHAQKKTVETIIAQENDYVITVSSAHRHHWHVENRLHWPKDVVLKEDATATCAGYAITGVAILRTMVVNLLRANGYDSITEALDQLAHDINPLFFFLN